MAQEVNTTLPVALEATSYTPVDVTLNLHVEQLTNFTVRWARALQGFEVKLNRWFDVALVKVNLCGYAGVLLRHLLISSRSGMLVS